MAEKVRVLFSGDGVVSLNLLFSMWVIWTVDCCTRIAEARKSYEE